ncbi:MAG: hypothetical protein P4L41_17400 [Flavipsychrobacter sp.]|nr:hypothetical protein [Flavipsychrobacter sp.]
MNRHTLVKLPIIALLFAAILAGCSTDKNYLQKIVGSWVVDSVRLVAPGVPDSLSHKNDSKGQKWNFKNDGTFAVSLNSNNPNTGTYSINNVDTNYFLYLDNGSADIKNKARIVMQIQNITTKNLTLVADRGPANFTFYLTKY